MTDPWTDRLSDYLDGELPESERTGLEAHLRSCAACAETLTGLQRVVTRARGLEDRPPSRDLWPGISARIGGTRVPPRVSFSLPQLLAAGIALMVASGGAAWLLHPAPTAPPVATAAPGGGANPVTPVGTRTGSTIRAYDASVAELEAILEQGRGSLDTATVRVLEQNLALIDRAIEQARRAVAADSANLYLNSHLAETMRRKLDLLRQAAVLVATAS